MHLSDEFANSSLGETLVENPISGQSSELSLNMEPWSSRAHAAYDRIMDRLREVGNTELADEIQELISWFDGEDDMWLEQGLDTDATLGWKYIENGDFDGLYELMHHATPTNSINRRIAEVFRANYSVERESIYAEPQAAALSSLEQLG